MHKALTAPAGRRLLVAGLISGFVTLAIAVAAPAKADAAWDHCAAGNACAYRDAYGGCDIYYYSWHDSTWIGDYSEFGCGRSWDAASSLHNAGTLNGGHYEDVIFWTGTGYTGYGYCLPRGYYTPTLAGSVWNDHIRSHQWTYSHCDPNRVYTNLTAAAKPQSSHLAAAPGPDQGPVAPHDAPRRAAGACPETAPARPRPARTAVACACRDGTFSVHRAQRMTSIGVPIGMRRASWLSFALRTRPQPYAGSPG